MQMDRTRIIFVVIVGIAVLAACGFGAFTIISGMTSADPTPEPASRTNGRFSQYKQW